MKTFLQGQIDYIFFLYSLGFICLGVACFILSKDEKQRLPWGWLALFGLVHGFYECLGLMAVIWETEGWFAGLRWVIMALSYIFLVEFGRLSQIRLRGQGPGRWLLGVLFLLGMVGLVSGWNGLNATTRYALALVGGVWAGLALDMESRRDSRYRFCLLAASVGLLLYGLAAGLVTPPAGFFPANLINNESFTDLTSLPIQLVRGLLALWIAVMIAGYFRLTWPASEAGSHHQRAIYMYWVGTALALVLVLGWFLTQFLGNVARQQVYKDMESRAKLIIQRLTFELGEAEAAVKAMSGSPWIGPALWARSPEALAQANSVLDRYQARFDASQAYILDQAGTCIASSNRNDPDSFVNHNYGFRPYFHRAMEGQPGLYFALGVVSKKRGFYAAYPVRDPAGKIVGIAAIKTTLDKFQKELYESDPAFLIDPFGVIFLSSRPTLDYHSMWPVPVTPHTDFKAQYGTAEFTSIFPRPMAGGTTVPFGGNTYMLHRQAIQTPATPGWSLVLLGPTKQVIFYRGMGIATTFTVVLLILVFAGSNLSIRESANRIQASEARFRAMFAAAPEAVLVYDPESGKIIEVNPFMGQWLGYTQEELVNLEIEQVLAPDSRGALQDCTQEGGGFHPVARSRYQKKDGVLVDVECTGARINYGDQVRNLVFVRDITERKRAEAELAWDARVNASSADLSKALLTALPLEAIASLVQKHALQLTDSKLGVCGHFDSQTGALVAPAMTVAHGEAGAARVQAVEFHNACSVCSWIMDHGQALLTNSPQEDPRLTGVLPANLDIRRFLGVPARIDGKLVGLVALANADRDYTRRDQEVCERLAFLYALAIHRHRLDKSLRESEQGLKTILENVQTGVLLIDPETGVIVDANPVAINLIGAPKENIVGEPRRKFIHSPQGKDSPGTAGEETTANNEHLVFRPDGGSRWVIRTAVPVSLQGKHFWLESLVDITERRHWEETIQATNDKLHSLVAQVEERNRTMGLANDMADLLQACQVSEEAFEAISHFMPRFFPGDAGALYMLNSSRNLYEAVARWGPTPPEALVFAADECWSVRRGRLHRVDDIQRAMLCRHVSAAASSYLCVPLIAQGEARGVFHMQWGTQDADRVAAKAQVALAVAEDMAMALANLKLRETLRTQAIRDSLTGLFNRRYLEETMDRELNRIKRLEAQLAVIMMDLDHFKAYNDTYGHNAGDELLSALGRMLKSQIRGEDIACCYGGEEFLLIMPGTSLEVALERAELLRQTVQTLHLQNPGLKPITLSLGIAVYPEHGDTSLEIIRAADAALYLAKQAGRDRVMTPGATGEVRLRPISFPNRQDSI
jgi:diguanylate cyclase (GGDEF)-like protein/PAS domain S-box-containing protein